MKLSRVLNRIADAAYNQMWASVRLSGKSLRRYARKAAKNEDEIADLKNLLSMFTIEDLRGTFNHYMEMQKQAIHGQSGASTINFWKEKAGKQLKIIEAYKAIAKAKP